MNREQLEYSIEYACRLERLTAAFWGRLDKLLNLVLLCLGASAFTDLANLKLIGGFIAISSVWTIIYQPGAKSAIADQQRQHYEALLVKMAALTDVDLAEAFTKIKEKDSPELGCLSRAAEYATGLKIAGQATVEITWLDQLAALFAGDLIRKQKDAL